MPIGTRLNECDRNLGRMKAYTVDARGHPRFKLRSISARGGTALERDKKKDTRRSTRISRQIAITITSLDPAYDFRVECTTVVVNAHGCGAIVREELMKDTLVTVKLVSNSRSKKGRVVLGIPLNENTSWLTGLEFDSPSNFWEIENPPADWPV